MTEPRCTIRISNDRRRWPAADIDPARTTVIVRPDTTSTMMPARARQTTTTARSEHLLASSRATGALPPITANPRCRGKSP
jgi:hypothetical protein